MKSTPPNTRIGTATRRSGWIPTCVFASMLSAACRNPVAVAHVAKQGAYVAAISEQVTVAEGLGYQRRVCGSGTVVHELRMSASADLELRVVRNPTAHRDPSCLERYGGRDALALLDGRDSFVALAFVNGNFFHVVHSGFASNGFLWSAGAPDGTMAPVESVLDPDYRGDRLVIAEGARATELRLTTSRCVPGQCRSTVVADVSIPGLGRGTDLDDVALASTIRSAFPHASAALQLTPALVEQRSCGTGPCPRVPSRYVECVPEHRWTCDPHSVTFLCVHEDRTISLIASEKAIYAPLVSALSEGGTCGTDCAALYLLDGGGSTQLGFRHDTDEPLRMVYAGKFDASPRPGCATFRPVDHYLVVGRRTP